MVNDTDLATFENDTGEGVVSFEPWQTSGPDYDKDHSRWYCHLTVAGERVFEYGYPCGTCGIVFRKVGSAADRVSDAQAAQLLGNLDAIPPDDSLRSLARVLQPGVYCRSIVAGRVTLVEPGAPNDYFATDVVRLFGKEAPEFTEPAGPRTAYYRLGSARIVNLKGPDASADRTRRWSPPWLCRCMTLLTSIATASSIGKECTLLA